jgi:hypothetical protein
LRLVGGGNRVKEKVMKEEGREGNRPLYCVV